MKKILSFISVLVCSALSHAFGQTFNGSGGAIPDNGATPTCFNITVGGIGTINNTFGLATVCIDVTHAWDSDIEIALHAPDGTIVFLSVQNGGSGTNYTGTCFSMSATTSIGTGTAPFTGSYVPDEPLGAMNNGQNADGVWSLCIQDVLGGYTGTLNSWSITFNNSPAPPPPVQPPCLGNPAAGDACSSATPVCNFNGYCGNTSASYNVDTWSQLTTLFCGTLENNSFITFVASATTASFNVWVSNSNLGYGIQMMFYDGGCGSGAVTSYGCYNQINPGTFPSVITATGLTPGNTYYLMFDGYAGDVCDYTIAPLSGVNILNVTTTVGGSTSSSATICLGESINLSASGGGTTYTWTGPNLNSNTGTTVIATPTVTSVYTVTSADPSGNCPITKDFTVNVTTTPPPPTVTSPLILCQNSIAGPLTATGTSLLWYTTATGGTGSATAPTPTTGTAGSTTYYVTQTLSCGESVRVPLTVNVLAGSPLPTVNNNVTYCQNAVATALTATGASLLWYTVPVGGTGSSTAPTPSTAIIGTTIYYVSQTANCGESPRAAITVQINGVNPPIVTSPVSYCTGATATPLTATGTGLLWYLFPSGGTSSATAPTPSTAFAGTTTYYVSQTGNGCTSPRASIAVNVVSSTAAPTATSPVTYCEGVSASALTAVGTNLLWYTVSTGGTGSATAPVPSTSAAGTVTYYVSQTSNCGESPRTAINVVTNPIPAAPTVGSSPSYCVGSTATPLTATGSNLYWYTTPTGGNGVSSLTPSTAVVGTSTYYVSQTLLGCTSPRTPLDVTITGLPPAPVVSPSAFTYCQNSTSQVLTATGTSLLWYTTATGGTGSATAPVPSTAVSDTFNYYVTQTLSCGESPRALIAVTIDPTPSAPAVSSPVVYCQGTSASALTANGSNLLWYNDAVGGTGSATAPTPSTTNTGNTIYYVSATIGVCEGPRAAITVTINVTPPVPAVTTPVNYCEGNLAVALTANGTGLLWYSNPSGGNGVPTAPVPVCTVAGVIPYYVSQTLGVCEGPRALIEVNTLPTPNLGTDQKDTVCFGESFDLTNVFNTSGLSTSWSYNGNPVADPAAIAESGTYQLIATNASNCSDTAMFLFNVRPPVLAFAGNDTIAVKGQPHQLTATGGYTYSWSPAAPLDPSYNPTGAIQMATLNDDQMFVVTAYNTIGCSDKDTVFIRVYEKPANYYYVPNAFSPNGDGINDIFRPVPVGINNTEWFRVYNRWGNLIFSSNKWLKGWDGTYQDRLQPTGTYIWMIRYRDTDGTYKIIKGTFLLLN